MYTPPKRCSPKFLFSSCILSTFALTINAYEIFPRELISLILSRYYILETHIDITGICRQNLFEQIWRFARFKYDDSISNEFALYKAIECLISLPGSTEKTYCHNYRTVPIFVNIGQESNIIDVSDFDGIYGKNMFRFIVDMIHKWTNRPDITLYTDYQNFNICIFDKLKENQKVAIQKLNDVIAEGIVMTTNSTNTWVKITETYSVYYKLGNTYPIPNVLILLAK